MNEIQLKEFERVLKETGRENAILKKRLILIEEELKNRGLMKEFDRLVNYNED